MNSRQKMKLQRGVGSRRNSEFFLSLFLVALSHQACGGGNQAYQNALHEGEAARRDHNFRKEQDAFNRAEAAADKDDERAEALYRRAHSLLREGKVATAAENFESLARKYPRASRAPRAWLDAGRCWESAKNRAAAARAYETVWSKYPESGNALTAAKRTVQLDQSHDQADVWRTILIKNRSDSLRPALLYELGLSLEASAPAEAIASFEQVAKLAPLPDGVYTDEALLHAAKLRRAAGDFPGAVQTLELLVPSGGSAAIVGSYNRPAFVEALLLQGRILRDDLREFDRAHDTFLAVLERFPESRLVDDALWEAAVTEHLSHGDGCSGIKKLREMRPTSSFLRASTTVCPKTEE